MAVRSKLSSRYAGFSGASVMLAAVFVLQPLGEDPRALASAPCSFKPPVVIVRSVGEAVRLSVGPGGEILVNDQRCEYDPYDDVDPPQTADTENTSTVRVDGTPTVDDVTIDQGGEGGPFPDTVSFSLWLEKDPGDTLHVDLTDLDDVVRGDPYALYLYGDRSGTVSLDGVDVVEIDARDGVDVIDAGDPDGDDVVTGTLSAPDPGPLVPPITIWGGGGADFLVGGEGDDHLYGQGGSDWLDGDDGTDVLIGSEGEDQCRFTDRYRTCDPEIHLEPSSALAGESVVAKGAGWYPENGDISIDSEGTDRSTIVQDLGDDGSFEKELGVPAGGSTRIVSACQQCFNIVVNEDSTRFVYAAPSSVTLDITPSQVTDGGRVTVSGSGWTPDQPVLVFLDREGGVDGSPVAGKTAGEDRTFETRFVVEDLEPGDFRVSACQRCGTPEELRRARILHVVVVVEEPSTIKVEPASANVGESLTVSGDAWRPDLGEVSVWVRGAPVAAGEVVPVAALAEGSFVVRLDVPDVAAGAHTVVACQRCDSPEPIEATMIVSILPAPLDPPWWSTATAKTVAAASLIAALAAAASLVWLRSRRPGRPQKPLQGGRIRARLSARAVQVSVTTVGDGSFDHVVRLVPLRDLGAQRVEEVSLR